MCPRAHQIRLFSAVELECVLGIAYAIARITVNRLICLWYPGTAKKATHDSALNLPLHPYHILFMAYQLHRLSR